MPVIKLQTQIKAPKSIVFDLSRSIGLHLISTVQTNEKAVDGRTSGLITLNETVTWEAKHFGITQYLTTMTDIFDYKSPLGILGNVADFLFLRKYMSRLLAKRNEVIKAFAEDGKCKLIVEN